MYHAREPEVNQWLNKRLGRTEFMPFAPATLYALARTAPAEIPALARYIDALSVRLRRPEPGPGAPPLPERPRARSSGSGEPAAPRRRAGR